jgi:transcriptional regulator with XRE-family HTH domain
MEGRTPFGDWLRQRRHLLDLTQAELAARCNCSAVTIRKLEAGDRKPSRELAGTLAGVLRIPAREQAAFIQFARSDDYEASFRLPAWEQDQTTWRGGQLPAAAPDMGPEFSSAVLHYDVVATEAPRSQQVKDGRGLFHVQAGGIVTGDIEGDITLRITQVIMPKPANLDYSQALPMQIGAFFTIQSGEDLLEGNFTGTLSPMLDAAGSGDAQMVGAGQVITVTPGFIDFFLNYVFVADIVKMVEGMGTGSRGTLQLKPAA